MIRNGTYTRINFIYFCISVYLKTVAVSMFQLHSTFEHTLNNAFSHFLRESIEVLTYALNVSIIVVQKLLQFEFYFLTILILVYTITSIKMILHHIFVFFTFCSRRLSRGLCPIVDFIIETSHRLTSDVPFLLRLPTIRLAFAVIQ